MEIVKQILLLQLESEMDGYSFRELLPFLTSRAPMLDMKARVYASYVRSSMTYRSDTRPLLANVGLKFERAEMHVIIIIIV